MKKDNAAELSIDRAVDLSDEVESRSSGGAAEKLTGLSGSVIARELMHLSPGFAQDVLRELSTDARERAISAAPPDVASQWQRNAMYDPGTVGRMMEPVVAAFPPEGNVGDVIEELRELVTRALITYVYVVDEGDHLLGIVTMRDLLFSTRDRTLEDVMLRGAFALHAAMPLQEAMRLVLDRHYPVYPVVDAERRLIGLVRGQTMFEAQAYEISLQAGTMVGLEKEERLATPWVHSLKLRHPWL
ncbi:MAG TPA: CBS domain-containing protein, partial [Burkholderiales bacterium]|nr:CBS domain-containing protein [Burkholderiales bacterium]